MRWTADRNYTVNAGPLEAGSWYGQSDSQGTRFAGEGGHFIDTVSWWLGADPISAQAVATPGDPDNLMALLTYPDGSVAKIAYLTAGDPKYPKEVLEAFGDGKVARMDNFKRTELWRGGKCKKARTHLDKGQKHELEAFVAAIKAGADMPVTFDSLLETTACTLAIGRSIVSGKCEPIAGWDDAAEPEATEDGKLLGKAGRAVNLTWYARRLARMSPAEIKGRSADAWLKRRWRVRQVRPCDTDALPLPASIPAFASGISPAEANTLSEEARARLLRTADAALCRALPLLRSRTRRLVGRSPTGSSIREPAGGRPTRPTHSISIAAMSIRSAPSNMSGSRHATTSSPSSPLPIS